MIATTRRTQLSAFFLGALLSSSLSFAGPGGTVITGDKTASVDSKRTERYTWELQKKTLPNQVPAVLKKDEKVTVPFTITVRRNGPFLQEETSFVSGKVCLENEGDSTTRNLRARDQLEVLVDDEWTPVGGSIPLDFDGELDPDEKRCVDYQLDGVQINPEARYRNHVVASIDNYRGFEGTRHSIDLFADVEIHRSSAIVDATAELKDLLTCPAGFACEIETSVDGTLSGSAEFAVNVTIENKSVDCGQNFRFENTATLDPATSHVLLSASAFISIYTGTCDDTDPGCVRTQGFWGSSPQGQALVPVLVPGVMNLGLPGYNASQLDQILDLPVAGNALVSLAHQLIAAKLNILAGASPATIGGMIAQADTLIASLGVPPIGSDDVPSSTPLGQSMDTVKTQLDLFTHGELGVPHCE